MQTPDLLKRVPPLKVTQISGESSALKNTRYFVRNSIEYKENPVKSSSPISLTPKCIPSSPYGDITLTKKNQGNQKKSGGNPRLISTRKGTEGDTAELNVSNAGSGVSLKGLIEKSARFKEKSPLVIRQYLSLIQSKTNLQQEEPLSFLKRKSFDQTPQISPKIVSMSLHEDDSSFIPLRNNMNKISCSAYPTHYRRGAINESLGSQSIEHCITNSEISGDLQSLGKNEKETVQKGRALFFKDKSAEKTNEELLEILKKTARVLKNYQKENEMLKLEIQRLREGKSKKKTADQVFLSARNSKISTKGVLGHKKAVHLHKS